MSDDFISYSPKRSPKAMTNAKWTASDNYRNNYDAAMEDSNDVRVYEKRPHCASCDSPIIARSDCECGARSWVYR
jgi:hypothetical protein